MSILEKLFHKKEIAEKQRKYDEYKEKFKELGIEFLCTNDLEIAYLEKVYNQFVILFNDNPEIPKGFLSKVYVGNQAWYEKLEKVIKDNYVLGSTHWYSDNKKLLVSIFISTNRMTEHVFDLREKTLHIDNGKTIESVVTHEFSHLMEYYILYKKNGWKDVNDLGKAYKAVNMGEVSGNQTVSEEKELIDMCNTIIKSYGYSREFRFKILDSVGCRFGSNATYNYQEFFAEAMAQYYCSSKPDPMAITMYNEFKKMKKQFMEN